MPLPFSVTRLLNRNDLRDLAGQFGNRESRGHVNGEAVLSDLNKDAVGLQSGFCSRLFPGRSGERNEFARHSPQQLYLKLRLKAGRRMWTRIHALCPPEVNVILAMQRLIPGADRASMDV